MSFIIDVNVAWAFGISKRRISNLKWPCFFLKALSADGYLGKSDLIVLSEKIKFKEVLLNMKQTENVFCQRKIIEMFRF